MDAQILKEYRRRRSILGETATEALRAARIIVTFKAAETAGLVRFDVELDQDATDPAEYMDTWTDLSEARRARAIKDERNRMDRLGVYQIATFTKRGCRWEMADSCYGFTGDDWRDSGCDVDLMRAALEGAPEPARCAVCGTVFDRCPGCDE